MINYLKVRNLAIVEEFAVDLSEGLTVLTGETGAGKSLLIDSLELLSGARSSTEIIRTGEDRMSAEAIVDAPPSVVRLLEESSVEYESRGDASVELVIRRELNRAGRGRVSINGSLTTVRDLAAIMDACVEIHGQSLSHDRIAGRSFRQTLDAFGGLAREVTTSIERYEAWRARAEELERLTAAQQELSLKLDLLKYQVDEISAAKLRPGEEAELRSERAVLAHAKDLISSASAAFQALDDSEDSALTQIGRAEHALHTLAASIRDVAGIATELEEIRYRLTDTARAIGNLAESTRIDPARLEEIEDRLVVIERLRRKYGSSEEEILEHLARARDEYERLTDYDGSVSALTREESKLFDEWREVAAQLSQKRAAAARRFETAIRRELDDLAMEGTTVRVVVDAAPQAGSRLSLSGTETAFGPEGYDRVDILIAPNRGEDPKPLHRIASGGELSRIQLAIATATFEASGRASGTTLVFDEIDSGVGGRVAEAIGRKLRSLAESNQVICVTHLPQIASQGHAHFRVWKEEKDGRTRARIERLENPEARIEEIARMLGGEAVSESARRHAVELLGLAKPRRSRELAPRS